MEGRTSWLERRGRDVIVYVHAKPRASRSRVLEARNGELDVALCAPPIDGAANDELVRLLSKVLGVSRSRVHLQRGQTSRHKVVRVEGLELDAALSAFGI